MSNFVKYRMIKCGEIKSHPPDWRGLKPIWVWECGEVNSLAGSKQARLEKDWGIKKDVPLGTSFC
ncbi:MAG TPA: hypothetical protein PLN63_02215 [Paludibacteraceae bacterium]|nr:hypothetical protein [Paludibacteraceae bacterium]HOU67372.1 hypothetical protein [Paludibacteraceae bacterium]HPH62427.1 hypothetical protein [Paludibacteraceae bacterium]HQF49518.1 hypothetical protein [Paludibacteraceae bacterium]HQJ89187.1 hypothetical protein [Paludibacteraceae bacterium]